MYSQDILLWIEDVYYSQAMDVYYIDLTHVLSTPLVILTYF